MTFARLLPLAAFLAALLLASWRVALPGNGLPVPVASHTPHALPASIERAMLPRFGQPTGGASLAMLPDGRLAAVWQGRQDNGDDGLWFSVLGTTGWQAPVLAAMRESSAAGSLARVGQLEQPLLQVEGHQLAVWYATSVFGEVDGGTLYVGRSNDAGKTWQNAWRLRTGPLAAIGGTPLALLAQDNGDSLLALAEGRLLSIDAGGRLRQQHRQRAVPHATWRAMVVADTGHLLSLIGRDGGLQLLASTDGGASWQSGAPLPAGIADQPAALLRLNDGRLLLAANRSDRRSLQLWTSRDLGATWQAGKIVESGDDGAADFTQPALAQTRDDRIHLVYRWRQQGLRHLRFSPAWLEEVAP